MSKASKQRDCPAVGRMISATECVAKRHQPYACPATCPHDPFAPENYSRLLELEGRVDHKSMDHFMELAPDRAAAEKAFQAATKHPNLHAAHAWWIWNLLLATVASGRTFCQRWEQAGFAGLKSDQQVILRAKMQTRMVLLEIHRVLDGEQVEGVDLLAPGSPPMRFRDRSLASVAVRFACGLTWAYPLPHYWRLSGTAALIPEMAQFSAEEIVTEIVRHLGGPTEVEAMRRWLTENLVRFDDALQATCRMRRMQMFTGMDARYGKAVYELQAPFAACRKRLDEVPDVELDDLSDADRQEGFAEGRVWFTTEAGPAHKAVPAGARAVLGRVLLGQSHWRVEAFGGERFADLRAKFEQCLGTSVRMTGERIDNLGAGLAAKEPPVNEAVVPPKLLADPQRIMMASSRIAMPPANQSPEQTKLDLMQAADRAFLEDQIPALDNKTPREAANDPTLRPRLVRLLKQRVRQQDERNLADGRTDDINWMLCELGVTEILFDPPPWRPPSAPPISDDDLEDEELFEPIGNPDLPPAPPLPPTPWSMEEVVERLKEGVAQCDLAADAFDELYDSGLTLIDDAAEIASDLLSEEDFSFVVPFLLQVALVFVPPGHRSPPVDFDAFDQAFSDSLKELEEATRASSPDEMMKFPAHCAQPQLMMVIMGELFNTATTGPKKLRPKTELQGVYLALVRAAVDTLDQALRARGRHY